MPSTTMGTLFYYYSSGTTAVHVPGMMTKPALPGLPQRVDSTTQDETVATSVAGVKQLGDTNFQFKHAPMNSSTNYATLKALEGKKTKCGVLYPDGGAVEFSGKPYIQRDATGVNALDTFTLACFVEGDFDAAATPPANIVTIQNGLIGATP